MRIITAEELKDILAKHKKWLNDDEDGEKADLRETDLSGAALQGTDLQYASLLHADLSSTDLRYASLLHADLSRTDLRCADLREADLRDANLYGTDLRCVYRPWLVYAGNIGSRRSETLYFADYDSVRCGCWNDYKGGTLAEFKERIDKVYSADSENEEYQRYRIEYLSAIKMFESMREAYLKSAEKEKSNDQL